MAGRKRKKYPIDIVSSGFVIGGNKVGDTMNGCADMDLFQIEQDGSVCIWQSYDDVIKVDKERDRFSGVWVRITPAAVRDLVRAHQNSFPHMYSRPQP